LWRYGGGSQRWQGMNPDYCNVTPDKHSGVAEVGTEHSNVKFSATGDDEVLCFWDIVSTASFSCCIPKLPLQIENNDRVEAATATFQR
jgi:hypothetical protein